MLDMFLRKIVLDMLNKRKRNIGKVAPILVYHKYWNVLSNLHSTVGQGCPELHLPLI